MHPVNQLNYSGSWAEPNPNTCPCGHADRAERYVMAKRYIGDAVISINYRDREDDYKGTVTAGRHRWKFDALRPPRAWDIARDSAEAYDLMAGSAVSFGSYYTTYNRGADTPDWAPPAETSDAIAKATAWAQDDQGNYDVKRTKPKSNPRKIGPRRKRNPGKSRQDPDTLQRFVEAKTREIIRAVDEGWDEADIEDLEAERDAVLEELGHHGATYRRRAQDSINRIEGDAARASYHAPTIAPRGKRPQ